MEGLAGQWRMAYRVYRVRLVAPAPVELRDATVGPDRQPAYPWAHDAEGVLVAEGFNAPDGVTHIRTYDPTQETDQLLTAVTCLNVQDDHTLEAFLSHWGLLGLVEPDNEVQLWDSVRWTRDTLARVGRLARWLQAMQAPQWRSRALPSMEEVRQVVPGVPKRLNAPKRARSYWLAFANELNRGLWRCPVRALLLPKGRSVQHYFRPRCLADVLYLGLWRVATEGNMVLRECPGCHGLYRVNRTNRKRRWCSAACKNRMNVRRWRANQ